MQAVILAGGLGTRLRPFTNLIPKPLLPIGEQSVLEIQIARLKASGVTEVFLATNFKSEYIQNFFGDGSRYGIKLHISKEEVPLGTAGPLTLIKDRLTGPFLMMNGDILSTADFKKFYDFGIAQGTELCVAIKELITPFAFGNIFYEGDFVTGIQEKQPIKTQIMSGIYFMTMDIFKHIPEGQYYGMDKLILDMLAKGNPVAKYHLHEFWLDIGQINDFEQAQDLYKEHFAEGAEGA